MSGRRTRSRPAAVAAVLVAVLLAVAAVAVAAGTKTASKTVAPHGAETASAQCGSGQRAQLAGFRTTLQEFGPYVHPRALVISGPSVRAGGVNEQGGPSDGPGKVTAFAYCGTRRFLGKAGAFRTLGAGSRGATTAECPKGMSLGAGGFRADIAKGGDGALVYVDGLERVSSRKWRASAINAGSAPGKVVALAYCFPGSEAVTTVTKSVSISPGNSGSVTATCPKGKTLAFGGVRSQHYGPGYGELQLSSMTRKGTRGWRVSALKYVNSVGTLTSVAYCH